MFARTSGCSLWYPRHTGAAAHLSCAVAVPEHRQRSWFVGIASPTRTGTWLRHGCVWGGGAFSQSWPSRRTRGARSRGAGPRGTRSRGSTLKRGHAQEGHGCAGDVDLLGRGVPVGDAHQVPERRAGHVCARPVRVLPCVRGNLSQGVVGGGGEQRITFGRGQPRRRNVRGETEINRRTTVSYTTQHQFVPRESGRRCGLCQWRQSVPPQERPNSDSQRTPLLMPASMTAWYDG